jgi:hypothetical protein
MKCLPRPLQRAGGCRRSPAKSASVSIRIPSPLSQTKLQANGPDHRVKNVFPERPKTPLQAARADRADLVGHRFSPFPVEHDDGFGGAEPLLIGTA